MIKLVLAFFSFLYVLMTILPMVRSDYWTFRLLEYPRLQKLVIGLVLLVVVLLNRVILDNIVWWYLIPLVLCIMYLCIKIFPYTALSPKEMKRIRISAPEKELKIFTANVLQDNRHYDKMLQQIKQKDPDIIFLVETDKKWEEALQVLEQEYSYTLKYPLDNTYGLLFYSRLEVMDGEVKFIVEDDVPSIEVTVKLENGIPVRIFGLHPKPPVPKEALYSTAKDKELMKVALKIEHFEDPCIVMGDLNDVAWSYVTKLFRKVSSLIDPRRGRGFYSTFSANNRWMRFPLDYIFCSSHFGLISMKRMPHNGSDHFAMFIHLQYQEQLEKKQEKPEADKEEKEAAVEKAA
jgi:endonuclease/exonuclease/phosphatase (EEP) superfamily protein YafD